MGGAAVAGPDKTPDLALKEIQGLPGEGIAPTFGPDRHQRRNDHSGHDTCREGDHRRYDNVTGHHGLLRPPTVLLSDHYSETR
jgi:hypothetical protein